MKKAGPSKKTTPAPSRDPLDSILSSMGPVPSRSTPSRPAPAPRAPTSSSSSRPSPPTPGVSSMFSSMRIPKKSSSCSEVPSKKQRLEETSAEISGQPTKVTLNVWKMDMRNSPPLIDLYDVKVSLTGITGRTVEPTGNNIRNDFFDQKRRVALWNFLHWLARNHPNFKGVSPSKMVYDGVTTLYVSSRTLREEKIEFDMTGDELPTLLKELYPITVQNAHVLITKTDRTVVLQDGAVKKGENNLEERARFLEILTSQFLYSGSHYMFNQRFFPKNEEKREEKTVEGYKAAILKRGFEKSVRFIDENGQKTPTLCLDVRCNAFYKEQSLADCLKDLLKVERTSEIAKHQRKFENAMAQLKGVRVVTTHMRERPQRFNIDGLSPKNAIETTFKLKEGEEEREISVYDYFKERHMMTLEFPQLRLIVRRRKAALDFMPIELLEIEAGQKVNQKKVDSVVQEFVTKESQQKPHSHLKSINEYFKHLSLRSSKSDYMHAFGITIEAEPMTVDAKLIPGPNVLFKSSTVPTKRRSFQSLDGRFSKNLLNQIQSHGITVEDKNVILKRAPINQPEHLEELIEEVVKLGVNFIFAVSDGKCKGVHEYLKFYEAKLGIQTQHVSEKSLKEIGNERSVTWKNIIRKTNLKAVGLNFSLQVSDEAHGVPKDLFKDTMFVGFELSHSAAQSSFDQLYRVPTEEPSIVGMAYSLKEPTELGGTFWVQKPRDTQLNECGVHMVKAVREYFEKTKKMPGRMVIYRSGMGEGAFETVEKEILEIKKNLEESDDLKKMNRGQPFRPPLVVIVVQKTNPYRIFLKNGDQVENVRSGTCTDAIVPVTKYEEFIMASQKPVIGTSRPIRHTIILNESGSSKNEIVHMTYILAFGHQVSYMGAPKVTGVMFAAENTAKRGRANTMAFKMVNMSDESEADRRARQAEAIESARSGVAYEDRALNARIRVLADGVAGLIRRFHHMFWA
ncbi:unnamed protein product [Caenorhabditis auriculariae]|uniref:Piwi domain-containing protein n=1 Tax=Caenorhabditis auriculariae TaxID=2777116 RepID=A0A8S1HPK3_9PELO|nr:unnamed protein product [Caenorhabditis auriculariae]